MQADFFAGKGKKLLVGIFDSDLKGVFQIKIAVEIGIGIEVVWFQVMIYSILIRKSPFGGFRGREPKER